MRWQSRETGASWIPVSALVTAGCVTVGEIFDFSLACFHIYKISLTVILSHI